jgi:hypothetical protein
MRMREMILSNSIFSGPITLAPELDSIWHHSTFAELSQLLFKPRELKEDHWAPDETKMLRDAISEISEGKVIPNTMDHMYWISTRIFQGMKSPLQVEWKVL